MNSGKDRSPIAPRVRPSARGFVAAPGSTAMTDAAMWREKAALPRERAAEATDAKKKKELDTLAEDCEEMAASLRLP